MNGNEQEICDLMIPTEGGELVKFQWANTANQIKTGIAFCKSYAKAINAETPFILIDNAEAITANNREFGDKVQTICMVAEEHESVKTYTEEVPFPEVTQKVVVREVFVDAPEGQISMFDGVERG